MIEEWLKSNRNYVLAWVITLALFAFAVRVNVGVKVSPPSGHIQRLR